jgi:hypothetical protein
MHDDLQCIFFDCQPDVQMLPPGCFLLRSEHEALVLFDCKPPQTDRVS